ncbi:MAG: hypothetical protein Edafosvirus5_61 [Edafosvirus sp.]|uniref:Uncharacterized protein n=1 Tax=Edafosvirus sp. TaxID=2487765 RepID=A0A3G4ZX28_9VIRU|nr:MAG: hypothetical protein Edafosvirus5_61 [Edafosvirus sp.]
MEFQYMICYNGFNKYNYIISYIGYSYFNPITCNSGGTIVCPVE